MITSSNCKKILTALLLAVLLFTSACAAQTTSRFEKAQQESKARGASAVVKESTSGGSFNKYFPNSSDGYKRVYTQEKKGFAEAKLEKDGKELAVMAISDTTNNISAVQKFKTSARTIEGYPAVNQGSTGTAVLVGDRYQVKVLSRDPAFSESDRAAWLSKFDLKGLSQLQ
jgi:opacity protein-like surface antigen